MNKKASRCQVDKWGWVEIVISILAGIWAIIVGLVAALWRNHNEKIKSMNADIGRHYSEINNLKVDYSALKNEVNNHVEKFEHISNSILSLREEMRDGLLRIEDKLDHFRERRNQ